MSDARYSWWCCTMLRENAGATSSQRRIASRRMAWHGASWRVVAHRLSLSLFSSLRDSPVHPPVLSTHTAHILFLLHWLSTSITHTLYSLVTLSRYLTLFWIEIVDIRASWIALKLRENDKFTAHKCLIVISFFHLYRFILLIYFLFFIQFLLYYSRNLHIC